MIRQIFTVTFIGLQSVPRRIGTAWVIVIGIAATVAVLASVVAMAEGFSRAVKGSARVDRAIVIRAGSVAEISSTLSRHDAQVITDAPGVKRSAAGAPLASAESVAIVALPLKSSDTPSNITLRGVTPIEKTVRPEFHLVAGRMFKPGLRELVVGRAASLQFKGVDIGDRLHLNDADWTVVGVFESGGDSHESELQGDLETVRGSGGEGVQSVTVVLESPAAIAAFRAALNGDPSLSVDVQSEVDYFASQMKALTRLLETISGLVGGIMVLGAIFAAVNTMYFAVSERTREIATLRALGYGGLPVVVSVLAEAMCLALVGAILGSALAFLLFNGNVLNTLGGGFSQVVFRLTLTPDLLLRSVSLACFVGLLGGLLPALRAVRLPISEALRAT